MIKVESIHPNGVVADSPIEVSLNGSMICFEDVCYDTFYIHRLAWDGVVKAVQTLLEEEKKQATKSPLQGDC